MSLKDDLKLDVPGWFRDVITIDDDAPVLDRVDGCLSITHADVDLKDDDGLIKALGSINPWIGPGLDPGLNEDMMDRQGVEVLPPSGSSGTNGVMDSLRDISRRFYIPSAAVHLVYATESAWRGWKAWTVPRYRDDPDDVQNSWAFLQGHPLAWSVNLVHGLPTSEVIQTSGVPDEMSFIISTGDGFMADGGARGVHDDRLDAYGDTLDELIVDEAKRVDAYYDLDGTDRDTGVFMIGATIDGHYRWITIDGDGSVSMTTSRLAGD